MRRFDPNRQNYDYRSSSTHHQHQQNQQKQSHQQRHQEKLKIDPSEVPKLSLTNITSEDNLTPPLRNRNIEKHDPRNLPQFRGEQRNQLGGSLKFPTIGKKSELLNSEYQGEISQNNRRKDRLKPPPRELKPLTHAAVERFQEQSFESSSQQNLQSLSRPGRAPLQPLNPMLKSSSLSRINNESQRLEPTNLPPPSQKKSLAPLPHSGRIQPVHSTRPCIADESSSATAAVETSSTKTADEMESAPKKVKVKKTKKSTRDWDKISENDLEKDWEKGDDSFELEHEFERIQRIQAKKSQKMSSVLDSNDPAQIAKLIQSGGLEQKGGMFFITLKEKQADGSDWTTAAQDKLASYWSALLRTNSLSGNVFNLEPGQLLVSVDKGWLMKEVMDFVLTREEVVKITKDNKDYFPKSDDSNEDDEL